MRRLPLFWVKVEAKRSVPASMRISPLLMKGTVMRVVLPEMVLV
jgi:hypothetical protein